MDKFNVFATASSVFDPEGDQEISALQALVEKELEGLAVIVNCPSSADRIGAKIASEIARELIGTIEGGGIRPATWPSLTLGSYGRGANLFYMSLQKVEAVGVMGACMEGPKHLTCEVQNDGHAYYSVRINLPS